jgi:inosine-uridine nucleoside N-ribohydrolase
MEKIILDTDIGSDIDDAVCLAYLLSQPKCDLLGITTVSGEADKRAMLASVLCKAAGKDGIPIYPGVESPLLTPQKQPRAAQAEALGRWEHTKNFPKGEAIEFLRQTIRRYPHEITLLTIGPMTNIGLLFSIDPEIPQLLKQLVLMCGVFHYKTDHFTCLSEWNARCDPYATSIVYSSSTKKIKSIGLDVTTKAVMDKNAVMENFTSDILKPVLDFSGTWFEQTKEITFHDPLAAATIFDESICTFETGDVHVEPQGKYTEGLTFFIPNEKGNNEAAMGVDSKKFFNHFFNIVRES